MKGMAECLFLGGPGGDETLTLPAMHCRDRLSLELEGWFEAGDDGGVNVMRGRRPPGADWECYTRAIYEKDGSSESDRVTYRFQGTETVDRCAQILTLRNRRCKHEAKHGNKYCRQHMKSTESHPKNHRS
jgi:hypothetical protein